ncbi:MAG: hypothetical protein AAF846_30020 [Chloroflexota bacterium]
MDVISTGQWRSYLPEYRFPRVLRLTCGCLGLLLLGGGLFTFLIAPGLIATIVTLNEGAVLEIRVGESVMVDDYDLRLESVSDDTRCAGTSLCETAGTVTLMFSTTQTTDDLMVVFVEGTTFSEPVALSGGYLMRVTAVLPDGAVAETDYTIQFQLFEPPSTTQN